MSAAGSAGTPVAGMVAAGSSAPVPPAVAAAGGRSGSSAAEGGKGGSRPPPPNQAGGGSPEEPTAGARGVMRSSVSADTAPSIPDADYAAFISQINAFGLDLGSEVARSNQLTQSNLIYSPLSAALALGMTYAGAKGQTATEMKTALRDSFAEGAFHTASNRLTRELASRVTSRPDSGGNVHKLELNLADALFVDRTVTLMDPFLDVLAREYDSGVTQVDFIGNHEPARATINAWVEEQTKDKIEDLLPEGSVTDLTRLVLVNALYFYGSWATPFTPSATQNATFNTLAGGTPQVPTMHGEQRLSYRAADTFEVAELPYEGEALRMTLVLPAAGQFEAVRAQASAAWLEQAVSGLEPTLLSVSLPKFEMTVGSFSLREGLQALGMQQAFSDAADFSGITGSTQVSLSDVVQKAFIAVDENGTEAAAATGVIAGVTSAAGDPPIVFTVDRPFLFYIRDANGTVLFSGQVVDPSL